MADCRRDVIEVNRQPLGFDDEFFDLRAQKICALRSGGARKLCDHSSYAWAGFEKAIIEQLGNDLMGSVGIDLEFARECSYRRKGFSGP
jgi:hypothetical protein